MIEYLSFWPLSICYALCAMRNTMITSFVWAPLEYFVEPLNNWVSSGYFWVGESICLGDKRNRDLVKEIFWGWTVADKCTQLFLLWIVLWATGNLSSVCRHIRDLLCSIIISVFVCTYVCWMRYYLGPMKEYIIRFRFVDLYLGWELI